MYLAENVGGWAAGNIGMGRECIGGARYVHRGKQGNPAWLGVFATNSASRQPSTIFWALPYGHVGAIVASAQLCL